MKKNLLTNAVLLKLILLITCFMLVILYNKSMAAGVPAARSAGSRIVVNFKNDAVKNELTIRVKSGTATILQLFIFTPDGILVKSIPVSTNQSTTVKSLRKGLYLYECFDDDQRMKSGSLVIQ